MLVLPQVYLHHSYHQEITAAHTHSEPREFPLLTGIHYNQSTDFCTTCAPILQDFKDH